MEEEQPKEQPKDEIMEAQIKLQQAHQRKIQECSKEIEEILSKHGFTLEIKHNIVLIPKN